MFGSSDYRDSVAFSLQIYKPVLNTKQQCPGSMFNRQMCLHAPAVQPASCIQLALPQCGPFVSKRPVQDACKGCLQASTKFAEDLARPFVRNLYSIVDQVHRRIANSVKLQALPLSLPVTVSCGDRHRISAAHLPFSTSMRIEVLRSVIDGQQAVCKRAAV